MRHPLTLTAFLVLGTALAGCGERVDYEDADAVTLVDEYFNDTDLKSIADKLTQSMMASPVLAADQARKPVIMVEVVTNRTNEHIDVKSLTDKIRTAIARTGRVEVVDETARQTLPKEYDYQASGMTDPAASRGPGRQAPPDFVLRGDIAGSVHESKNQKTRVIFYKTTLQLTDVSRNVLAWTDDHELKKVRRK